MDVYLIPVDLDRYDLYFENLVQEEILIDAPAGSGWIAAIVHRFKVAVARAEREQQGGPRPIDRPLGWTERVKRRALRWMAEKITEWRLLWKLRKESAVTLFFPDDVTGEQAHAAMRAILRREADRHLKWIIIDGVLFCASGVVAIVPGPNAVAYYFGFRFVGHFLSRRGARHGLEEIEWTCQPSAPLSRLRHAARLAAPDRARHVQEVASALQLQHLATFFERAAVPAA